MLGEPLARRKCPALVKERCQRKHQLRGAIRTSFPSFTAWLGWKVKVVRALSQYVRQKPLIVSLLISGEIWGQYRANWTDLQLVEQSLPQSLDNRPVPTLTEVSVDLPQDSIFSCPRYSIVINDILRKSVDGKDGRNSLYIKMPEPGSQNIFKN